MARLVRKTKATGIIYASNSWWASELLADDFKKVWLHPEWEHAMQQWYKWLHERKKKDEKRRENKSMRNWLADFHG